MPFLLPTVNNTDSSFTTPLEGQRYEMRTRYNTFSGSWYCYIGHPGEVPVIKFKLVCGLDLLLPYSHLEKVPKGALYLFDSERDTGRPSRDDFGSDRRFKLIYFTEEEKENAIS